MRFLDRRTLLLLHDTILHTTGGEPGVLHPTTIDAALARSRFGPFPNEPDLALRAALLMRGLASDHPFVDGNKRTAWEATCEFVRMNGRRVRANQQEWEPVVLAVATARCNVDALAGWLRMRLTKLSSTGGSE